MNTYLAYKRKGTSLGRPYIEGEDLTNVSVNVVDTPRLGGMIFKNIDNEDDQCYVSEEYFKKYYEFI